MNANLRQVDGQHYVSEYQHWDWVADCDLGYLAGNASKYVARCHKKGGIVDLEKALHYLEKIGEDKPLRNGSALAMHRQDKTVTLSVENDLSIAQALALTHIALGNNTAAAATIRQMLDNMKKL